VGDLGGFGIIMNKIGLIIQKEYKTRVVKKSFILMTFLTPVLFIGIMALMMWLPTLQDSTAKHIIVIDHTNSYHDVLVSNEIYTFEFVDKPMETVREQNARSGEFTALLLINDDLAENPRGATLFSERQLGVDVRIHIENLLSRYVREQKLAAHNIPDLQEIIESSRANLEIATIRWGADGEKTETSAELALIIGMIAAMMIYLFLIMYGTQVMMGVMQEKSNRIVEVIISSVRPFELMLGKIIGIALVGLTQFLMWLILIFGFMAVGSSFLGENLDPNALMELNQMGGMSMTEMEMEIANVMQIITSFNWLQIGTLFVVYFLGGYLLYASLFAAVGSSVDNETDANQFTMPIMLPIILAIFAAIFSVRSPDSSVAFWFSIIPFTSPVVMMVRLPFDVPTWEILVSVAVLILSFIGTTWLAGKIYRTGILMYGKKPSWLEIWKWLRY